MKLKECNYGLLVRDIYTEMVGMIVGITQNEQERPEAMPEVKWQDGVTAKVHHSNLRLLP